MSRHEAKPGSESATSRAESQPDLTQRQFLKKLVGTAAGVAGLAAAGELLNPAPAEAAYSPGTGPLGADVVNTSLAIVGPRPWIDVTAYGAVGNASNPDWGAVQAAFNAVPADGGVVYFPPGRYLLSAPITLTNKNIQVVGAGRGVTRLIWTGGGGGFNFNYTSFGYNVTIQSLSLLTRVANSGNAITLAFTGWAGGGPLSQPHIFDIYIGPETPGAGQYWTAGIDVAQGTGFKLEHFEIVGGGAGTLYGVRLHSHSTITNIHAGFIYNVDQGIYVTSTPGVPSQGRSEGAYISNVEVVAARMGYHIDSEAPGSAITSCHASTTEVGIQLYLHGDMALTGNLLFGAGGGTWRGIYAIHSRYCTMTGNNIVNLGGGYKEGIVLLGNSYGCTVTGNILRGLNIGINVAANNNIITSNRLDGGGIAFGGAGNTYDNNV